MGTEGVTLLSFEELVEGKLYVFAAGGEPTLGIIFGIFHLSPYTVDGAQSNDGQHFEPVRKKNNYPFLLLSKKSVIIRNEEWAELKVLTSEAKLRWIYDKKQVDISLSEPFGYLEYGNDSEWEPKK